MVAYTALVLTLSGTAYAATGGTFVLGKSNVASTPTLLRNTGTGVGLSVTSNGAPFAVSNSKMVSRLDAQYLGGLDASKFQRKLGRLTFTSLTPINGWAGSCFGAGAPGVALDAEGVVHLRGALCASGTPSSSVAFVLPTAFRPTLPVWLTVDECDGYTGRINIATNGNVSVIDDPSAASTGQDTCFTSLDGTTYALPY